MVKHHIGEQKTFLSMRWQDTSLGLDEVVACSIKHSRFTAGITSMSEG